MGNYLNKESLLKLYNELCEQSQNQMYSIMNYLKENKINYGDVYTVLSFDDKSFLPCCYPCMNTPHMGLAHASEELSFSWIDNDELYVIPFRYFEGYYEGLYNRRGRYAK